MFLLIHCGKAITGLNTLGGTLNKLFKVYQNVSFVTDLSFYKNQHRVLFDCPFLTTFHPANWAQLRYTCMREAGCSCEWQEGRKEMFYLTMHSTHFLWLFGLGCKGPFRQRERKSAATTSCCVRVTD